MVAPGSSMSIIKKCKTHGILGLTDLKANGRCKHCHRATANTKRNQNREWFNAKMAEDKIKNPEKWKDIYKRSYQRLLANHGKEVLYTRKLREILKKRNLTVVEYEQMIVDQDNRCAICCQPETRKDPKNPRICRLCIDHCHTTGEARELLCHSCNTGIGKFKENPELFRAAIAYLEKHK
jgi:hypothetical protein